MVDEQLDTVEHVAVTDTVEHVDEIPQCYNRDCVASAGEDKLVLKSAQGATLQCTVVGTDKNVTGVSIVTSVD